MALKIYSGAAGDGFANEFDSFLRIESQLPSIDAILKDPDHAPVPDMTRSEGPATMYALCGALADQCDLNNAKAKKNFESVVRYSDRIPKEFSVVLIRDATNRNEDLMETDPFMKWAIRNQDIVA
jgi:hypothetical protein